MTQLIQGLKHVQNPKDRQDPPDTTLDRASVVDANFIRRVQAVDFPNLRTSTTPFEAGLSKEDALKILKIQMTSRHLDLIARKLRDRHQAFYTIGSSGHEGNAAIALAFRPTDMAFLHYRSLAFMLARAEQVPELAKNAIRDHLLALVASKEDPIAGGRHKVFGSLPLWVPPQTSTIASHLPKAVGAAYSIPLAKELQWVGKLPYDSVVLCSFGDASVNHSTALGSFNAAAWIKHHQVPLPIVFVCEDNGIGVSVPTPSDWIEINFNDRPEIEYIACDGLNFCNVYQAARCAERVARKQKKPVFLHFKTVRLLGHAGSDIEFHYHTVEEIQRIENQDPLLHSARIIIEAGFTTADNILDEYEEIRKQVAKISDEVIQTPKLENASEIMSCLIPPRRQEDINSDSKKTIVQKKEHNNKHDKKREKESNPEPKHMAVLLNRVLAETLKHFPNAVIFGEDVGKKGGVYRITTGLQAEFGKRRVFDTLLDEQTILGTAIGLAHNNFLPIPEIQFLAFLHNAEDQIRGEAATLSFFSQGQFTNPMILRLPGLAYQQGFGGHFHNDNAFAFLREIPGIIIACPSHGVDAVKMFRQCVQLAEEEQRVVIFLEPIALYMTKDLHQPNDGLWLGLYPDQEETIELGEMGVFGEGQDIIMITYGNGVYLSRQAEKILREHHGVKATLVDLRWLAPINHEKIIELIKPFSNILVVDEGRQTGSLSEEIMTEIVEYSESSSKSKVLPNIARITAKDCFIPLGNAAQALLPTRDEIVIQVLNMLSGKS